MGRMRTWWTLAALALLAAGLWSSRRLCGAGRHPCTEDATTAPKPPPPARLVPSPDAPTAPRGCPPPPEAPLALWKVSGEAASSLPGPAVLERFGGRFVRAFPPDAFLVAGSQDFAVRARSVPGVSRVEELSPADKTGPGLAEAFREGDGFARVRMVFSGEADARRVMAGLPPGTKPRLSARNPHRATVTARLDADAAAALAFDPAIEWIEEMPVHVPSNDRAQATDRLAVAPVRERLGLTGAGQCIAFADTGVGTGQMDEPHPDLAAVGGVSKFVAVQCWGRAAGQDWSDPVSHGTHIAGTLAGTGAASDGLYAGVAPGARLLFQSIGDANGALTGLPDDIRELYDAALEAPVRSDSWGRSSSSFYNVDSLALDEFAWDHPDRLVVVSAGNTGTDSAGKGIVQLQSINMPATAKNALTVGACESGRLPGEGGNTAVTYAELYPKRFQTSPIAGDYVSSAPGGLAEPQGMAAFSSRGPTDDGRVKPDVVAPGTDIVSAASPVATNRTDDTLHPNPAYAFQSGTSMATPFVAGTAVLVREALQRRDPSFSPSAALLKAALIGGAHSLSPGQYGTDPSCREIPAFSPNPVEGWGAVSLANTLRDAFFADSAAPLGTGGTAEYPLLVADGTPLLRVALVWTDPPPALASRHRLVNDLDLELVAPSGETFRLDDRNNNVEVLHVESPKPGTWRVRVEAAELLLPPQPFALHARGGSADPSLQLLHEPPTDTCATNEPIPIKAALAGAWLPPELSLRLAGESILPGGDTVTLDLPLSRDGAAWSAQLPAAPLGTVHSYRIEAADADGALVLSTPVHSVSVVSPVLLLVEGTPSPPVGNPAPPYGWNELPLGVTATLRAPPPVVEGSPLPERRWVCESWTGAGSVPAAGDGDALDFVPEEPSAVCWHFREEWPLRHVSEPGGAWNETAVDPALAWGIPGETVASLAAPETFVSEGVSFAFARWRLDGDFLPAPASPAGIAVRLDAPRDLCAVYLPRGDDTDGSGLPDWFEWRHFGELGQDPGADPDADGFPNAREAAFMSDPLDPASVPRYPVLALVAPPPAAPALEAGPAPARLACTFANHGNAPLSVTPELAPAGALPDTGWTPSDAEFPWRQTSATPDALDPRLSPEPPYWTSSAAANTAVMMPQSDVSLVSPPIHLPPPELALDTALYAIHCLRMEPDTNAVSRYWDAARVEFAPAAGDAPNDWTPLPPDGGFTASVVSNNASPFPPDAPCLENSPSWSVLRIPLSPLPDASPAIRLRFRAGTDAAISSEGWLVASPLVWPATRHASPSNWASVETSTIVVEPGESASVAVDVDPTALPPGAADFQLLLLHHDDPDLPSPLRIALFARAEPAGDDTCPDALSTVLGAPSAPLLRWPAPDPFAAPAALHAAGNILGDAPFVPVALVPPSPPVTTSPPLAPWLFPSPAFFTLAPKNEIPEKTP